MENGKIRISQSSKFDYLKVWEKFNEAIIALQQADEQINHIEDNRKPLIQSHIDLLGDLRERFKDTFYDLQATEDEKAEREG